MARIIVLGAGVCGLAAGILLRRDGHEVIVLERDADGVPASIDEAWERWARDGVAQFRQPHYLHSRVRIVLEETLPDVATALAAAGATRFNPVQLMPPFIADRLPRDGDERFETITARRPVLEQVLVQVARAEPGLELRNDVVVRELLATDYEGIPHVHGIRTEAGDELRADLVVDATGRRSVLPRWLEAAGAAPVYEEIEDSGFIYYTRFFRSRNGAIPEFRAPLLMPVGTISLLVLPSDNSTWSVTVFVSAGDRPLKRLRVTELWTAVIAACPLHAHWLEGEPITEIRAMGGIVDRYRRFVHAGRPIATGIAAVGDAWACSNPSAGRGISFGLLGVQRLCGVIREHLDHPLQFAQAWDAVTEAELTPWYRETVEEDRDRFAEIESLRNGRQPEQSPGSSSGLRRALLAAMARDPDLFRTFLATRCCLTPLREALADQNFVARITELARDSPSPPLAGPDRKQLLSLLDHAAA
ncbi:MAG: FAD-binding protein [Solirubrobacterales bacterium]|nr:FAD-binding protein [Solirubrobacterales bacterium]